MAIVFAFIVVLNRVLLSIDTAKNLKKPQKNANKFLNFFYFVLQESVIFDIYLGHTHILIVLLYSYSIICYCICMFLLGIIE